MTRRALVLLVVLAGACDRGPRYHRVELPGFSLELPVELGYHGDGKTDYRQGNIRQVDDRSIVMVAWQPGAVLSVDEMPAAVHAIASAAPELASIVLGNARAIQVGGQPATRLDSSYRGVSIAFVDIACGKRSVMVAFGRGRGFDEMAEHVLGSFACHASAADDAALETSAPIGIDDPKLLAGWSQMKNDDAFAMTDGKLIVLAVGVPNGGRYTAIVDRMIPGLFEGAGMTWQATTTQRRGGRDFQIGTMTSDADHAPAAIMTWSCESGDDAIIVLATAETEAALTSSLDFLTHLRCSRPGDPPLPIAPAK